MANNRSSTQTQTATTTRTYMKEIQKTKEYLNTLLGHLMTHLADRQFFFKCTMVKQRKVSEVPSWYMKTNNIHGRSTGFRIKNINNKNCGKLMSTLTQST
jgi:hypothetical protein